MVFGDIGGLTNPCPHTDDTEPVPLTLVDISHLKRGHVYKKYLGKYTYVSYHVGLCQNALYMTTRHSRWSHFGY